MTKTFAKFLVETRNINSRIKKYLKFVNEQKKVLDPNNNPVFALTVKELFQNIVDKQNTIVKVLVWDKDHDQFNGYSTKNEFHLVGDQVQLQYNPDQIKDGDESNVNDLNNDFNAMGQDGKNIEQAELKVQKAGENEVSNPIVYYDDETNAVFFAIGNGVNQQHVENFVNCVKAILQVNGNIDFSNQKILAAIEVYRDQPVILSILKQMLSIEQQNIVVPNINQANNDVDDDVDPQDIQNELAKANDGEDLNGLKYLGKLGENEKVEGFQLLMTMTDEDEFKRMVKAFPEDLKKSLAFAPIKWKQIDGTNKDKMTAIKRIGFFSYTQQKSLLMFYMNMKKPLLVKLIACPDRVIKTIMTFPAPRWSNMVWPYIFNGINNKDGTLEIMYDRDGFFKSKGYENQIPFVLDQNAQAGVQNADIAKNQQGGEQAADEPAKKQKREFDKDKIIVNWLIRRIKTNLDEYPYYYTATNNFSDSKHKVIIPGKRHRITDQDIENLAKHYKDWHYRDQSWKAQRFWSRVMDITQIDPALLVDPNMFNVERPQHQNQDIENVQTAVDDKMKNLPFITVDIVAGEVNRSANLPQDENSYFHVKIPGRNKNILIDDQAVQFLTKFGLDKAILPVYEEAKKAMNGIKLLVSLDNDLRKL